MTIRTHLLLACLAATGAIAAEPPVRAGLLLWLDASAQNALRQSASTPPLRTLQHADTWLDSSGRGQQAVQPVAGGRPVYRQSENAAFFRFDGKDDFLALAGPRLLTPAMTVFVLAAPKANAGGFPALFSTAESGKNDYTSGLNLDLGPAATDDLSVVNVESAGAAGFRDLLVPGILGAAERPFGAFHVFTVRTQMGKGGTELFFDGIKAGARDRLESNLGLDHITIGARRYSHDPLQPPHAQGFFHGDIAAVLVYDRVLTDAERGAVEQYLMKQTAVLHAMAGGTSGHTLETLADAPVAQMLVPGFTIRELPLRIGNLNNVRYRDDGKVIGLGYDGRIHVLSDGDGDGLEDKDELFWDHKTMRGAIGMVVTRKGDPRGEGVLVASKGKVSFFPDRDGDGRADEEKVVATGWKETFHGVDTLGLAMDPKDGALYFGLGCTNFADGYLMDARSGKSLYDVRGERGTIQRLSADFTTRETICTGIRFTCALAFNRAGDLFASEQEGATWLPNGNPFDELLHIERGKHYGFPPRHPKHLPDVIDEPAVIEYGPQHQSTVGMVFNEGVNGGPFFGPAHWEGDAIMCGESRGKIWRTKLAKTPLGYVAQNHLIACFGLLVVDACVTPQGDLLVACHSGPPDWGTGPAGEGRLFKISHQRREVPQPVIAWASAPDEFRVAFDRPLDPADWSTAKSKVRIEAGRFVSAGDRYETVRPGYQVVRDQMAAPRRWVDVLGLSLSHDRRTLVLRVPRQTERVGYAITLPVPEKWRGQDGLPQKPEMDLAVTLNGLQAELADGKQRVVLPHPSPVISRELTRGSAEHATFLDAAAAPAAALILRGSLDASNPFVPAVQPGSKLDWDMTTDAFSSAVFAVSRDDGRRVEVVKNAAGRVQPLSPVTFKTAELGANGLYLSHEKLRHVLSPQRVFVPWMLDESAASQSPDPARSREDVKGHWLSGRRLFFGEGACFTCHTIGGEGIAFGPDLSNLIHRDRDSVLHDLLQPSATINPDQSASLITLKDGTSLSGIIVTAAAGQAITLALPGGARLDIEREKIAATDPLKISLMPADLEQRLNAKQQEDLLTFLLVNPLDPTVITRTEPPAPAARSRAELAQFLPPPPAPEARAVWKPLRILLSAGEKDHGVDEHDYPVWLQRWSKLLALADGVTLTTCMGFPGAAQLDGADVTVFYSRNQGWSAHAAALLDAYQKRGGGLVYLHFAIAGGKEMQLLAERAGLAFGLSAFRHGAMDLVFTDPAHPITRGFSKLHFIDESYWKLHGDPKRLGVLATSLEDNEPRPQLWTLENNGGRVFGCIPGHYMWTFDDPLYRLLVLRGICWAARQPDTDRLSELSTIGARLAP
ncbi:MAG: ThuA domain-containing protein [Verrucomicrobiota bacterium]|nr:ThuA domain-containing protein [Verrucomicrobiota bacterium]